MPGLLADKRLQISLVDHNKLNQSADSELLRIPSSYPFAGSLAPAVVECIDHHADEGLYGSTLQYKHIEVVASCSSLITEVYQWLAV